MVNMVKMHFGYTLPLCFAAYAQKKTPGIGVKVGYFGYVIVLIMSVRFLD